MIKVSKFFWFLTFLLVGVGLFCGFFSAYLEITEGSPVGLFFMVGCAFFLALSGVFATLASKFQSKGK